MLRLTKYDQLVFTVLQMMTIRTVGAKSRLLFPALTMLDISNNRLSSIPPSISDLTGLSVLNISGNSGERWQNIPKIHLIQPASEKFSTIVFELLIFADISELPPEMGLLGRLWNLNCRGCGLQDPLRSMIDSRKYRVSLLFSTV